MPLNKGPSLRYSWRYEQVALNNEGLDVLHPVEQVDKNHYSRMDDVKSLQEGTITPRPGTGLLNSTAFVVPPVAGFVAGTASETEQGCSTGAVNVTSGAVDTYGSYTTIIASTARISKYWVFTMIFNIGLPDREHAMHLDISFDAGSGPEVNFIEGHTITVARKTTSVFSTGDVIQFPFEVPAGSRIRIRTQENVIGGQVYSFTASMIG